MNKRNLFLYFIFFINLNLIQTRAEDLSEEYKTQQDCSWEKAAYKFVSNTAEEDRFCIDNKSNIYQIMNKGRRGIFSGMDISAFGPTRLGNLKKPEVTTGNSCILGTNIQCLSNVVYTTTQYKIEGNYLKKYTRREMNGDKSKVNSSIIGINRNAKSELLEKARIANIRALKFYEEGKLDDAGYAAASSINWLLNQSALYILAQAQLEDGTYINLAFNNINSLINSKSSIPIGLNERYAEEDNYYFLRALIKNGLRMNKNTICADIEKAIELRSDNDELKNVYNTTFNNLVCTK